MNKVIFIALLAATPVLVQAETHGGPLRWARRATLAGSCVAGTVVNAWAMHRLASEPNAQQVSGLFISNGKPHYRELIGIGAGTCAFSTLMQETNIFAGHARSSDLVSTFGNLGSLGFSTWETLKYLSLTDQARASRIQPGTLK